MATHFFAVAAGLLWAVRGQMTEIPDPMYGCTDGSAQPALQIAYPNLDGPISCGTQISMEVAQDQPLLTWPQAIDYYDDCEGDAAVDCVFTVMLINNDGALDGFCEAGGICINPVYHHVITNMNAVDMAAGIIPPGGEVPPPPAQTGPTHEMVDYYGPDPFAPGLVSPVDFRFHYSYIIFAQEEYTLMDDDKFFSGASLADIMEEYNLTPIEQVYFLASIDGCDDGEDVCRPCPETNSVYYDDANSPDQCTDLCDAPNYLGFPMLPEFVEPCFEVCERCENFEAARISGDSSGSPAATVGIALAAVAAVAATVAGAVKYWKPASDGKHVQLLDASTLSELDAEIAGASVESFQIEASVASV